MYRTLALAGVVALMCVAFAGDCLAQGNSPRFAFGGARMPTRSASGGGLFARLNKPLVPTMPGLPTASPLGLIAPRMSNAVTIFQKGGFSTTPPKTPKAMWTYGLTILSPRAAVAVGMIRGAMGMTAGLR